jgi:hypothetical protein
MRTLISYEGPFTGPNQTYNVYIFIYICIYMCMYIYVCIHIWEVQGEGGGGVRVVRYLVLPQVLRLRDCWPPG